MISMGNETAISGHSVLMPSGQNNKKFTGRTNTLSLLGKLEQEGGVGKGRKLEIDSRQGEAIARLAGIYEEYEAHSIYFLHDACKMLAPLAEAGAYTADDAGKFARILAGISDESGLGKPGYFISALINLSRESDFALDLGTAGKNICCLGYKNAKNVKVAGSIGVSAFYEMESGTVEISGDWKYSHIGQQLRGGRILIRAERADSELAFVNSMIGQMMTGGEIEIFGNVEWTGANMHGGSIKVHGNAGSGLGYKMKGGTIEVFGRLLKPLPEMEGGDIFVGGVQVVKGGKQIAEIKNE